MEEHLERWKFALERRVMKVSRSKTEYPCVNERNSGGTVRLQEAEVKNFKYNSPEQQRNWKKRRRNVSTHVGTGGEVKLIKQKCHDSSS